MFTDHIQSNFRTKTAATLGLLCLFLMISPIGISYAQFFGASEQAGVIEKKVVQEAEENLKSEEQVATFEEEEKDDIPVSSDLKFFINKVLIDGNEQIPYEYLEPIIEPYENNEVTMKDLKELAQNLENEYRRQGFITSRVFIPPQKVIEGVIKMRIVEGKTGNIEIIGNKHFKTEQILSYSVMKKGEVVEYKDLMKTLKGMNANPDRKVKAIIKKGTTPETSDLIFNVKDSFPLHLGFSFDNQGNLSTGLKRFGFNVRHNNFLGKDDTLYTGTVFGKHFGVFFAQYVYPIAAWGTKIVAGFSHAQVSPKRDFEPFGVNGISQTYFLRIIQPLITTNVFQLGLSLGGEFKESKTKVLSGTFRRDRLRVLRFGPNMSYRTKKSSTFWENTFNFGIPLFSSFTFLDPSGTTRTNTESTFFKISGNATHTRKMPWNTTLSAKVNYQYSADKLPSSEAFYMGGLNSVRGYPEGDYLSDTGIYYNLEYFIPTFFVPKTWQLPYAEVPLHQQVQFVTFLDHGYGRLRNANSSERQWAHLFSVGGGLRIKVYKDLYARTEWAVPLGDRAITEDVNDRFRFHFRLQMEL